MVIQSTKKNDLDYFKKGEVENPQFWSRLKRDPSFEGLTVLDIGCGHGSLCVDMASKGTKKVVGIDINDKLIRFARENVLLNYPQLQDKIDFRCCDIAELDEGESFDIIVSKSAFEHILNLDNVLFEIYKRLKTGGKLYVGFGPLYNSPFGDHKRTKAIIPWGHLIFPESFLIKRLNITRQNKIESIHNLGLNKLSLSEYKDILFNSGLDVLFFGVNGNTPIPRLFSLIRRVPFLEEYFSISLFCILEKSNAKCDSNKKE